MQAAFFKLSEVLPLDEAIAHLKDSIVKSYGRKGEKVVNMNYQAVDKGIEELKEIKYPQSWKDLKDEKEEKKETTKFFEEVAEVMNAQKCDTLPVSKLKHSKQSKLKARD